MITANQEHTPPLPGSLLIFNDPKNKSKPDDSGCNTIGVLLNNNSIIYHKNRKPANIQLNDAIKSFEKVFAFINNDEATSKCTANYFEKNGHNYKLFNLGIWAMKNKCTEILCSDEIMPSQFKNYTHDSYETAWNKLRSVIEPCDAIFVRTKGSLLSSFIARLDNGFWSHVGTYIGSGQIHEATTRGILIQSINKYKGQQYSVGVYRPIGIDDYKKFIILNRTLKTVGRRYNYSGALKLGICLLLSLGTDKPSPNELIYRGYLQPIYII